MGNNLKQHIIADDPNSPCQSWAMPTVDAAGQGTRLVASDYGDKLTAIKQQAHNEGFQQGRNEGLANAQAAINAKLAELDTILNALQHPVTQITKDIEKQILQIITVLTRQCLQYELTINPEIIIGIISEMVAHLHSEDDKNILHVSAEDFAVLQGFSADGLFDLSKFQIQSDANLRRGEAILANSQAKIDATITGRLENIAEKISQQSADE